MKAKQTQEVAGMRFTLDGEMDQTGPIFWNARSFYYERLWIISSMVSHNTGCIASKKYNKARNCSQKDN